MEMGARALDILIALLSRPNEVVSKRELLAQVWADVTVGENSLRGHIVSLRKVLDSRRQLFGPSQRTHFWNSAQGRSLLGFLERTGSADGGYVRVLAPTQTY